MDEALDQRSVIVMPAADLVLDGEPTAARLLELAADPPQA